MIMARTAERPGISRGCEAEIRFRISVGQCMRIAAEGPGKAKSRGVMRASREFLQEYQDVERIIMIGILCFAVDWLCHETWRPGI